MSCLFYSPILLAEFAVVVSIDSPVTEMNKQQVSNIFLSRTNRFTNGEKANPLELKKSQLRTEFYQHISSKTRTQLKSYWTTLIFTGKGKPPKSFSSISELLDHMGSHSGSIAYVPLRQVTNGMKVIYQFSVE